MDNIFRIKKVRDTPSRPKQELVSGTLDSIHQGIVSEIKETGMSIQELREHVRMNEVIIKDLEQSSELEDILRISSLLAENGDIHARLSHEDPMKEYYLKNADIMLKYYGNSEKASIVSNSLADQNTFVKFLVASTPSNECVGHTKKELFEEYASRMKLNTGTDHAKQSVMAEHCERCNISREEVTDEGILVCPKCGSEEYMMVVSDFPSFRDPPKERNNYAYKKINHLNEILNQFQAKESTIIPDEVMHEVICEIKKRRIQNVAELTEKDMREILKKLNRSKYYEHATHILSRLNGNPPPTITPEIEEKIRAMFQEIQAPFLLYCPDDRTNFLSYSYILFKFFELLGLDEYKVYFPLLKSRDRLIQHDQIWKKICDYLRWEFIQSV
jgi:Poxvirus Late Transcription Factor VLTF3 like